MKSKLDRVLENLEQIKKWKRMGATDEQICQQLGIKKTSWYKYIKENPEVADAIKYSVEGFVLDLRGELARQCFKRTLETKKSYIKIDLETGHKTQYTEITTKELDGNIAAIHLLLKNLDKDNWKDSWDSFNFKKQEMELRRKLAEDQLL